MKKLHNWATVKNGIFAGAASPYFLFGNTPKWRQMREPLVQKSWLAVGHAIDGAYRLETDYGKHKETA